MPVQLPFPYTPGLPGSGLGDPAEYADSIQANLDALTTGGLATSDVSTFSRGLLGAQSASAARTTLGLGLTRGVVSGTWPGGTPIGTAITVTHSLGATPTEVLAQPVSPNDWACWYISAIGSTTFVINFRAMTITPANGAAVTFHWTAWP